MYIYIYRSFLNKIGLFDHRYYCLFWLVQLITKSNIYPLSMTCYWLLLLLLFLYLCICFIPAQFRLRVVLWFCRCGFTGLSSLCLSKGLCGSGCSGLCLAGAMGSGWGFGLNIALNPLNPKTLKPWTLNPKTLNPLNPKNLLNPLNPKPETLKL